MYLFIHPYLPIHLPILPFTYPQGHSSIRHVSNPICPFIHSSIPLSISLTIYPIICSSFCSPTLTINHLSTYLLNYQPIHPSTYSSIFSPIHPHVCYLSIYHLSGYSFTFIHSSIGPSICPSFYVFLPTHPSIYPPFHLCILHPRVLLLPVVGMFH